jgi:hypothetical protein
MTRARLRLPSWTAHPGFGVAVLFALAVILVIHGEPQPSSRPSGTSVVPSGTETAPVSPPALLEIRKGVIEWRLNSAARDIPLPDGARPRTLVTSGGLSVALATVGDRQHAYAITRELRVTDLGLADGVIPAASAGAVLIIETALTDPGAVMQPDTSASGSPSAETSGTTQPGNTPPLLRDFRIRRYDAAAKQIGPSSLLPTGMRLATDSPVGLVVWQPAKRVFDAGVPIEALSANAALIRPDGSLRSIGAVHPLAASAQDLLVWDVKTREFGLMPLRYVTSNATTTESAAASATSAASSSAARESVTPSPTVSPSTVAATRWFLPTKGFVVTGPASFKPDSSSFAVYAQVGMRRRLVVADVSKVGTDQVEVLALVQPNVKSTASASATATIPNPTSGATGTSPPKSQTPSIPAFEPDGFPIGAPLWPLWWGDLVVGLAPDGAVIGYQPGTDQAALLDLGVTGIESLAAAP